MDRNFSYRRGSSPQSKRRERLQKQKKFADHHQSPTSSDQEIYAKSHAVKAPHSQVPASGQQCLHEQAKYAQHLQQKKSQQQQPSSHVSHSYCQKEAPKSGKAELPQQKGSLAKKEDSPESTKKNSSGSDRSHRLSKAQNEQHGQTQPDSKTYQPIAKTQAEHYKSSQLLDEQDDKTMRKKAKELFEQQSPSVQPELVERKVLDDRYLLLKTIGHGRYAKVKLAVDLKTKRQVAIKILKVKPGEATEFSKRLSLECLFKEISILADCDHQNIVKIKAANFDGVTTTLLCPASQSEESLLRRGTDSSSNGSDLVSRQLNSLVQASSCDGMAEEDRLEARRSYGSDDHASEEPVVIKRRGPICYFVMNFAKYGELFRLVEINSERLSEPAVRYLFRQLIDGLSYLHKTKGVVHRDIKPENLLIDKHFRLVIADFNFATRLTPLYEVAGAQSEMPQTSQIFEPTVRRDISVGSVAYNAPELWEIESRLAELRQRGHDLTEVECLKYDGVKADIFSAAVTLFLLISKFQPFRRAHPNDPYYKRLAFKGTKYFWKIYSKVHTSQNFKDIFEKASGHKPEGRPETSDVLDHEFVCDSPDLSDEIKKEILRAFKNVEEVLGDVAEPFTDEISGNHRMDDSCDSEREEWVRHDEEEFEKLRHALIAEVHRINKSLRKRRFMKHVAKNQLFYQGSSQLESSPQTLTKGHQQAPSEWLNRTQLKDQMPNYKKEGIAQHRDKETAAAASVNPDSAAAGMSDQQPIFQMMPTEHVAAVSQEPREFEYQPACEQALQHQQQHQPPAFYAALKAVAAKHRSCHSDENKSQRSDDSSTLARESRRARRTSSFSRFTSFHEEDEE